MGDETNPKIKIYATPHNQKLRDIAIEIEKEHFGNVVASRREVDLRRVHLWIRFNKIQSIYPVDARHINIDIDQVKHCEKRQQNCPNRWVEIPNDYEDVKVHDFDHMIRSQCKNVKYDINFEIGVEIFDLAT